MKRLPQLSPLSGNLRMAPEKGQILDPLHLSQQASDILRCKQLAR